MSNTELLSWGRYPVFKQTSIEINSRIDLPKKLAFAHENYGTTLPYGSGLSYGDSCLAVNDHVLRTKLLNRFINIDWSTGLLIAESGVTFEEILNLIIPHGWFLPVTPGTKYITLGGAIANDIHGKNHHKKGTIGLYVREFGLFRSDLGRITCSPKKNIEFFNATIGGLGLTGIIEWVEIQLMPIASSWVNGLTKKFRNLDGFFALSDELDNNYEYSVSWIDCSSKGRNLGRGIYMAANFSSNKQLNVIDKKKYRIPFVPPVSLINKFSLKIFNEIYWLRHPEVNVNYITNYDSFFYPLDSILEWNKIYGPKGFQQYQCLIPENNAKKGVHSIIEFISKSGMGSFLAVIKRFGDIPSPGLLSFPKKGITLSLDFPHVDKLESKLFPNIDAIVSELGGRIYPAKDAHMAGKDFRNSYPLWSNLESIRDPALMSRFWKRVIQ
jgi:FAD/FMN-containing dehydrogenase